MIRQIKYYLIAISAWSFVRAMVHEWNNPGFDLVFDVRILSSIIPLCFAALIVALNELLKNKKEHAVEIEIPYFQSLDIAPAPGDMAGKFIYIKDDVCVYRSDGTSWVPVTT